MTTDQERTFWNVCVQQSVSIAAAAAIKQFVESLFESGSAELQMRDAGGIHDRASD